MLKCFFNSKLFAVTAAAFLMFGLVGCDNGSKNNPAGGDDYQLTIVLNPSDGGTVIPPSGESYKAGDTVTLFATPADGYTFSGWTGDAKGGSLVTTVVINKNLTVTANFTPTGTGNGNNTLVLGNNEAWVACGEDVEECNGMIFKENGDLFEIIYNEDVDTWFGMAGTTTYTVSNNTITIYMLGTPVTTCTYSISGNTLTITDSDGEVVSFTKSSNLKITIVGGDPGDGGTGGDNRLVVNDNEAWVGCDEDGDCEALIFKADGQFIGAEYNEDDDTYYVSPIDITTYTAKDGIITVYVFGIIPMSSTYSISGDTLTITDDDGEVSVYTKTSGVNIVILDNDDILFKSSSNKKSSSALFKSLKIKSSSTLLGKTLSKAVQK